MNLLHCFFITCLLQLRSMAFAFGVNNNHYGQRETLQIQLKSSSRCQLALVQSVFSRALVFFSLKLAAHPSIGQSMRNTSHHVSEEERERMEIKNHPPGICFVTRVVLNCSSMTCVNITDTLTVK